MADYRNLKKGELLIVEGDRADSMYIVKSGQLSVFITEKGIEREVSQVAPGMLIGEMGLFDKKARSAGVRATCDAIVVILPYAQLKKQMESLPEWVRITMRNLSEKLRETNKKISIK